MFKIFKVCLSFVFLAAFIWFGMKVNLGDRTLFGHLRAIGQSKESKDLYTGTKEKVGGLLNKAGAKAENAGEAAKAEGQSAKDDKTKIAAGPPQEHLTEADRQGMKHLLESARGNAAK